MLKVGITGGIGSGKSLIARMFGLLGVPVFNADEAAKYLMVHDQVLKNGLIAAFGQEVYKEGRLNRPFLSSMVFEHAEQLQQLNALVHPAVIAYGKAWMARQTTPYVLKEAALFFESGSFREMDKMIGVFAPEGMRLARATKRDGIGEEQIRKRMVNQMDEEEKMARCDYVLYNDETRSVIQQVRQLHAHLLQMGTT